MKLANLNTVEAINQESLTFINGGIASLEDSRRWDSTSQDSKKNDTYTSPK